MDPEWDALAADGVQATEIALTINYRYLRPGNSFGFTLADL